MTDVADGVGWSSLDSCLLTASFNTAGAELPWKYILRMQQEMVLVSPSSDSFGF
jgi:hypothetical protein